MTGRRLEADIHVIHGIGSRIRNTVHCVKGIGLKVEGVAFGGLAAAQVMVTPHQKEMGALVLDIGGGTTDFALYRDGAIHGSGVFPIGGDHITHDVSKIFHISMAQAEQLKIEEGSALREENSLPREIRLLPQGAFTGGTVDRRVLNKTIHLRMKETFELIGQSSSKDYDLSVIGAGIFITGGTSNLRRLSELAEGIFDIPVYVAPWPHGILGSSWSENPCFSVALGLIKYAQAVNPSPLMR
jgi:cell division protein FtsA